MGQNPVAGELVLGQTFMAQLGIEGERFVAVAGGNSVGGRRRGKRIVRELRVNANDVDGGKKGCGRSKSRSGSGTGVLGGVSLAEIRGSVHRGFEKGIRDSRYA